MSRESDEFRRWRKRLEFISKEYTFGPIQEKKDADGRLHCLNGPALITPTSCCDYVNGRKHGLYVDVFGTIVYYYEDVAVPRKFILNPASLTLEEVMSEPNAEIKAIGIKIIGFDKVKNDRRVKMIHQDEKTGAELFCISGLFSFPWTIVKVVNATPEADGTRKHYFLQVPPDMKTCADAIAWTFKKETYDYHPEQEA